MCKPTDDSIMTLAVAQAILSSKNDYSDLEENTIACKVWGEILLIVVMAIVFTNFPYFCSRTPYGGVD